MSSNNKLPTLVFIHGMWSTQQVWLHWIKWFQKRGYECLSFDLPGHEQPEVKNRQPYKLQDYVQFVTKQLRNVKSPVLIGHSLGGLIAQLVASQTSPSGLVLVNSAAPGQIFPIRTKVIPGVVRHLLRWGLWKKVFHLSQREARYLVFNKAPKTEIENQFPKMTGESGRVFYQVGYGFLNLAGSNRVKTDDVSCPLLLLAGDKDRIIPVVVSRKAAALYGDRATYQELQNHGHWLIGEHGWKELLSQIDSWLQTNVNSMSNETLSSR
ncbi:hypothetical protein EOPP23_14360 [Endozoicomonas sp. OPT23]|uniref:alpha/beta hydrolase n=1 Tax=Endozoicomonas sp. OPT23 TaxID=2072845 RepID=UPI00129B1638|nr:alpha/beta hydrolase [Endozoicomonas sp. OPT23]MRI34173.1 hypothetical protein [Endozoicomonas sp. OPT23]